MSTDRWGYISSQQTFISVEVQKNEEDPDSNLSWEVQKREREGMNKSNTISLALSLPFSCLVFHIN